MFFLLPHACACVVVDQMDEDAALARALADSATPKKEKKTAAGAKGEAEKEAPKK